MVNRRRWELIKEEPLGNVRCMKLLKRGFCIDRNRLAGLKYAKNSVTNNTIDAQTYEKKIYTYIDLPYIQRCREDSKHMNETVNLAGQRWTRGTKL